MSRPRHFAAAGSYVMGRRMADGGEVPWGEEPPFRAPVFVVTNRPRETLVRRGRHERAPLVLDDRGSGS